MMKRVFTWMTVCLITFCTAMPASAQFAFGVKGGLNLSNNKASDLLTNGITNTVNVNNMTGFFIGPTAEFIVPVLGLGLDASLFYSQKGTEYSLKGLNIGSNTPKLKDKLHYLEIPINLKYKFKLPLIGFYAAFGPYFSYAVSGHRSISSYTDDIKELRSNDFYKAFDYGLNLGAGIELLSHLQIGLQYSWGLNDVAKDRIDNEGITAGSAFNVARNLKNRVFSVSVAYLF